jgi:phage head maturation protease
MDGLRNVDLFEFGPVTFPAYAGAVAAVEVTEAA